MATDGSAKSYPFMEFPLSMARQDAFPLDRSCLFYDLESAQEYASNDPTAYVGQIISVVTDGTAAAYQIKDANGALELFGGDVNIDYATDEEVKAMLDEVFGE